MPNYDYRCLLCSMIREVSHGMTESPVVVCECGGPMRKKIGNCNVIVRDTTRSLSRQDAARRDIDARTELREGHGIHSFTPFHGATAADVLRDVKGSGTLVKDQMAFEQHCNEKRRENKMKDWKPKAQRRASKRRAEMKERKAAEAMAKRRITI